MEKIKFIITSVLEPEWIMVSLAEVRSIGKRLLRVESSKLGYGKNEFGVLLGSLGSSNLNYILKFEPK